MSFDLTQRVSILHVKSGVRALVEDTLVSEHYLTLFINGRKRVTFSCLPEYLEEMILGYLLSEGVVEKTSDVEKLNFSEDGHKVDVSIKNGVQLPIESNFDCGRQLANFDAVVQEAGLKSLEGAPSFSVSKILSYYERFIEQSHLYKKTRAVHNSALCNEGGILFAAKDISRHNAIDKVIGMAHKKGIALSGTCILTSGRVPLDIAQFPELRQSRD
ncbi:formate dehydrogenase accessory protein FdhD [Thermacetogenium phaeum DSM 12270]|uniref:Formate dehydrogenase accessory protein FdhD n=1 Tax=Thermacetogenium phaeum (strain ATCC BAA-254 / DSM 26808 / PB) TaxID=1089553 RepID=K4LEL6_THEPS|nr:formate dehydrogenase accessory sulfurtransferase FdhD [Thermacetogenium phaeum]AFV10415.1 formate dehydrogenase accessory protein FdhD [Thermacetogenium phaeum DSM 12270]